MNSTTTIESFIAEWLRRIDGRYTQFEHIHLIENKSLRDEVYPHLSKTVFLYHNDPKRYKKDLELMGYSEVAEAFDLRPTEKAPTTRSGNFGEILASEYLRQVLGYDIPVFRLRYNPNPDSSMKGDDILAFKFGAEDGSGRVILVGESKVRQQFSTLVVQEAYEQLCSSVRRPHPISLTFVIHRLEDAGDLEKAEAIRTFLDQFAQYRPQKQWLICLTTGNAPRDPFGYLQGLDKLPPNLMAMNLSLEDLSDLIDRLFDWEVTSDDL
jgi:hypothetical protein